MFKRDHAVLVSNRNGTVCRSFHWCSKEHKKNIKRKRIVNSGNKTRAKEANIELKYKIVDYNFE